LEEVSRATGWRAGHVYAATPGPPPRLEEIGTWLLPEDPRIERFARAIAGPGARPNHGTVGRAMATGEVERTDDLPGELGSSVREAAAQAGLRAACAVPVMAGDEVVAVLEFFLIEPCPEDEELVGVVSAAAAQLGGLAQRGDAAHAPP
jgi:hypothetical protein